MAAARWTPAPIPNSTVDAVRAQLGPLVDETVSAVRAENPIYREVLQGPEGLGIRLGIEQAIMALGGKHRVRRRRLCHRGDRARFAGRG
jgi:hypothetical protein